MRTEQEDGNVLLGMFWGVVFSMPLYAAIYWLIF